MWYIYLQGVMTMLKWIASLFRRKREPVLIRIEVYDRKYKRYA